MCGRFNIDEKTLQRILDGYSQSVNAFKSGDVFPTDNVVTLTRTGITPAKWGFTRYDNKGTIINARAETVLQKTMFKSFSHGGRCVVPANDFYEWDEHKRKFYYKRADDEPIMLCGFMRDEPSGTRFVILTKPATEPVASIHDRIPVMAEHEQAEKYIGDFDFAAKFIMSPASFDIVAQK